MYHGIPGNRLCFFTPECHIRNVRCICVEFIQLRRPYIIAIGHTRIVGIKVEHNWQNFIYQQGTDFIISILYSRKQVQDRKEKRVIQSLLPGAISKIITSFIQPLYDQIAVVQDHGTTMGCTKGYHAVEGPFPTQVVDILVKLPAYNTALAVCYQESICR